MNILLVDDENRSRSYVAEFLRKLGHHVVEAGDGEQALALITRQDFNLLLTDNRMPRMSGLELLQELSDLPAARKVDKVIFTAFADMDNSIAAIRAGAFDYLLKPLDIDELVKTTERVARHQAEIRAKIIVQESPAETAVQTEVIPNPAGSDSSKVGVFSSQMEQVFSLALKLYHNRSIPVLIEGETGTGKELVARYIHFGEEKTNLPFVALNCAALSPNIFESELFGYEAGTFSGGLPQGKQGKLDMARGGTLFLDEISELPLDLQAKLLRVLQEKEFYRVGGLNLIKTDVRIICASNQRLQNLVKRGSFREDLYYRLNMGHVYIPPLRKQPEAIIPLTRMFMMEISEQANRQFKKIDPRAARIMEAYHWPGNVRELRNIIEWIVLMNDDTTIQPQHLDTLRLKTLENEQENPDKPILPDDFFLPPGSMPLDKISNDIILKALQLHDGNKTATARYLGISRSTLYYRLQLMEDAK
ncbi:MAG: sigma-54 dependent transcriptional regulator [Syntrophomonadaceae bacterium]|nr:sigma-54 dependent transcriptional regulator [Syntrophomonadaceae bacterium]